MEVKQERFYLIFLKLFIKAHPKLVLNFDRVFFLFAKFQSYPHPKPMEALQKKLYTESEYLELERVSPTKSEWTTPSFSDSKTKLFVLNTFFYNLLDLYSLN